MLALERVFLEAGEGERAVLEPLADGCSVVPHSLLVMSPPSPL